MAHATQAPAPAGGPTPHTHFPFWPAAKQARPVRALIDGPSSAQCTLTALRMAAALGERIAVIDSNRGAAAQFAGQLDFRYAVTELTRFEPLDLCAALHAATVTAAGADVVMVDSWSAWWSGPGGMLEQAGAATQRVARAAADPVNAGWRQVAPQERQMLDALHAAPAHLILVCRSVTETVLERDGEGRTRPVRYGLRPEQRRGSEYDVDIAVTVLPGGDLLITTSRIPGLDGKILTDDGSDLGRTLRAWADKGEDAAPRAEFLARVADPHATVASLTELDAEVARTRAAGMAVVTPSGEITSLGVVLERRLNAVRKLERAAAAAARRHAQAAPAPAPAAVPASVPEGSAA